MTKFLYLGVNPTAEREANDFYATDPIAIKLLLEQETFNNNVWECACGMGHLSKHLESEGYKVHSTDLIDRNYGQAGIDFLNITDTNLNTDIITNPPFKYGLEFVKKALDVVADGCKVAMFMKLNFLEEQKRKDFFKECPPRRVYVSSKRIVCAKNGDFDKYNASTIAYAWYIWEKGYKCNTVLKWI